MTIRAISYGGGVQSTAMLVLAAQRVIDFPIALFSNVGDDSEHPATLAYVREVAMPYAAAHRIELHELHKVLKDGSVETLYQRMMRMDIASIAIPVYMGSGAPGRRACTVDFKIGVVAKWLKQHGALATDPAWVAIGISTDEVERAGGKDQLDYERRVYPLLDLRLSRDDCRRVIADAGLDVPPKSSCFFCPYHRTETWQRLATDAPELFEKAVSLEERINEKRSARGKDKVYLTKYGKPLHEAIDDSQQDLFGGIGEDGCDSGYCWT